MNRLTSALLAALGLALALAGLAYADTLPDRSDASDQDLVLDLYMSQDSGGALARSFVSGTRGAHAVVGYENGRGQQFRLRVKDLSGITVYSADTEVFTGDGSWSTAISITDFVSTYADALSANQMALGEDLQALKAKCEAVPPVPAVWPPSDPNPSDDYSKWLKEVLDKLEGARSATYEMTRTVQAMASLPDVADDATLSAGLSSTRQGLVDAEIKRDQIKPKLQPSTGRPDPQAGCQLVDETIAAVDSANALLETTMTALPEDVSGWRLPTVAGRFEGAVFIGCQQYATDIIQLIGGRPADSATKGVAWSVGDAGAPALVFPSPEEADRSSVGRLDVMYAGGADAMYAQTVKVPNLNREAAVAAYVTDDKCIPIDGMEIAFAVDPSEAGTVDPATVDLVQGLAGASLLSGDIAARAGINAVITVSETQITGRGEFSVIGPASSVEFKGLRRNILNRAALQLRDRRISISVFATDANNAPVADLTQVLVEVRNDPNDIVTPGVLAYDRTNLASGMREVVDLGKRAELVSYQGFSTVFPCNPGYRCDNLYVMAGSEADGRFDLVATVDGEIAEARVQIVTEPEIFLPFLGQRFDVYAPPTYITIEAEPNSTPSPAEISGS